MFWYSHEGNLVSEKPVLINEKRFVVAQFCGVLAPGNVIRRTFISLIHATGIIVPFPFFIFSLPYNVGVLCKQTANLSHPLLARHY